MSTTTKDLLRAAATVVFAIAATATTVSSAFAAEAADAKADTAAAAVATTEAAGQAAEKVGQPHQRTRAEVRAEVIEARKNGTLLETEADFDVAHNLHQTGR